MRFLKRLAAIIAAGGVAAAVATVGHTEEKTITSASRSTTLILLKARGLLEEKLGPKGLRSSGPSSPWPAASRG
jgi:hypothetical protein